MWNENKASCKFKFNAVINIECEPFQKHEANQSWQQIPQL